MEATDEMWNLRDTHKRFVIMTNFHLMSQTYPNPLQDNPAYSVVKQYFVNPDDTVCQKIVVHKDGPRGNHFRRAGPRQRVYEPCAFQALFGSLAQFVLGNFDQ